MSLFILAGSTYLLGLISITVIEWSHLLIQDVDVWWAASTEGLNIACLI